MELCEPNRFYVPDITELCVWVFNDRGAQECFDVLFCLYADFNDSQP